MAICQVNVVSQLPLGFIPPLSPTLCSMSNTPGNLLEIYKVCWKFSGLVCEFAHLSLTLVTVLVFQSVSV